MDVKVKWLSCLLHKLCVYIYILWPWFILYKMIMIVRFKLHLGFDNDE